MAGSKLEATEAAASLKDKHEFLSGILKDTYAGLLDFEFKHGGFLALVMGWLITSNDARAFLSTNGVARYSICAALVLLTYFHHRWVGIYYYRSRNAFDLIRSLNFMPNDYLVLRAIPKSSYITFTITHTVISIVACLIVLGIST